MNMDERELMQMWSLKQTNRRQLPLAMALLRNGSSWEGPPCRVEDVARSCLENGDDCNTHPGSVFRTSLTELTNPLPLQEEVGINSSLLLTNTNPPTHPPLKTQWQKTLCIAGPEGNYSQPYFTCTSQTKPGSEVERCWGDIRSTSSWLQNEREKDENREIPLLGTSFNKGLFVNDVSTDWGGGGEQSLHFNIW